MLLKKTKQNKKLVPSGDKPLCMTVRRQYYIREWMGRSAYLIYELELWSSIAGEDLEWGETASMPSVEGWGCLQSLNFAWGRSPLPALLLDYPSGSTSWVKVVGFSLYLSALLHVVLHGNCKLIVPNTTKQTTDRPSAAGARYPGLPKQLWRTKTFRNSSNQRPASAQLWHCL